MLLLGLSVYILWTEKLSIEDGVSSKQDGPSEELHMIKFEWMHDTQKFLPLGI